MEEAFLQFTWKFQSFNKATLKTSLGESINIINPGFHNLDAGPDFLNAHIIINNISWHGHVEIHSKASQWNTHQHNNNPAYDNVILHVVYENDKNVFRKDKSMLPMLELSEKIDLSLYDNYRNLVSSITSVPCYYGIDKLSPSVKYSMLDKVLVRRLENKAQIIIDLLKANNNDWEETAHQVLAKNFGFKINSDSFYDLSKVLPYKIIRKQSDNLLQIEALLFGMANLLPKKPTDDYSIALNKEYTFLSHKYSLQDQQLKEGRWKFLRLRPANFPTIRLAQYASVFAKVNNFFSALIEIKNAEDAYTLFSVEQSNYWREHYSFNKTSSSLIAGLGQDSIENIIINTVCPLLAAYGIVKDETEYLSRAVNLLENMKSEKNKITKLLANVGFPMKNAFDSQASIELYNNFCLLKKCLQCNIGASIIKGGN